MKKEDEKAFLRSVLGVSPIERKNLQKKEIPNKLELAKKTPPKKITEYKATTMLNSPTSTTNPLRVESSNINRKLKRGKIPIDLKIDLHGLSLYEAEQIFSETVKSCYNRSLRCLLFITGKGIYKKPSSDVDKTKLYYGKIRNSFLGWSQKKELNKYILNVQQAGIEHGADGAFFIYLRKTKS